ncbi:MAG: hypothetical protein ACTSWP_08705 [Candidatus Freyarchaeota archaeon]|nr:hypothetical protein [Candidatus Freyrarchaeum guaymaensis]HDO81122.1 hypothetical protein [Candidatus Bathyarchaeota archaeon]
MQGVNYSIPLRNAVLSILKKRQGIIIDKELYAMLQKMFNDFSESKLNRILMQLEIEGLIHVSQISKTKRSVELIKPGQEFLAVSED